MRQKLSEATPGEKLLSLFSILLMSHRETSLKELAEYLETSKQTVLRLIDQLEGAKLGKVVCFKKGKENYYQISKPKELPVPVLNAEGITQFLLCRNFIQHLLPDKMKKEVDASLRKLAEFSIPGAVELFSNQATQPAMALTKGYIDFTPHQVTMRTILRSIVRKQVCLLEYKSAFNAEPRQYAFVPSQGYRIS
jgi:predicted DNA-binding transcriptional regulator YafY